MLLWLLLGLSVVLLISWQKTWGRLRQRLLLSLLWLWLLLLLLLLLSHLSFKPRNGLFNGLCRRDECNHPFPLLNHICLRFHHQLEICLDCRKLGRVVARAHLPRHVVHERLLVHHDKRLLVRQVCVQKRLHAVRVQGRRRAANLLLEGHWRRRSRGSGWGWRKGDWCR